MSAPLDVSRLALCGCIVLIQGLWVLVALPPNPDAEPQSRAGNVKDQLGFLVWLIPRTRFLLYAGHAAVAMLHSILIYTYPSPPKAICPQSSFSRLSDATLFTWNPLMVFILMLIITAAAIRIAAFRNLGVNFTFSLKQPSGLVKTGIHRYIQHPSYTGLIPIICCLFLLYARFDGLAACYLPSKWVEPVFGPLHLLGTTLFVTVLSAGTWARVTDEERMLKKAFGKEWEEYHRRTKRFIPGLI